MLKQIEPNFTALDATKVYEYMLSGGWCTEYKKTKEFEEAIAEFVGSKYAFAVPNGTTALTLALMAVGVKPGDEVIVPSLTMIATANAARMLGADIKFIDSDETGCMDINQTIKAITKKTKAVIYVSLNGRHNDLSSLFVRCKLKGVYLIEDACQSLGSYYGGRMLGTIGDIGCYSLSPHKIISTGQGGILVTNSNWFSRKIEALKDFGRLEPGVDWHPKFGINAKFTDIQAVLGLSQLSRICTRIAKKKYIFDRYRHNLKGVVKFIDTDLTKTTPWFVDIYLMRKTQLADFLKANEIETRPMYPPVHIQPCYNDSVCLRQCQVLSLEGLWLPSSLNLSDDDIDMVCNKIKEFCGTVE